MQDNLPDKPSPGRLFLSVFPSIMLPMFLAVVDQTIVATALPNIAASLGGVERISWVVVAYLLAATIAAPVYGQLRDVWGGKRMMFVALGIFLLASLACAASTSVEMLSFARVLQGLGGGGLMTLSQALIGEAIPPRERARFQGYLAGVAVSSSTFGPIVGGLLTQHFGWRSIFLVNLPLGLLAVFMTLRLEPREPRAQAWTFDTMGLVLFVAFITPLLLALQQAQRMSMSALPSFLVLATVGAVALVALVMRERRAPYPLLPIHLLRQATIWRSDALAACHGATLVSLITFIPIYLRVLRGTSAAETGLLLLPLMFGVGGGSMLTGRVVSRTGLTTIFPTVGLIFATLLLVLLSIFAGNLGPRQLSLYLFGCGLFMGTVMGVVQVTVQNAAGAASLGSAAASVQLSRSIGAAVGTALVGTVLFATLSLSDPDTAGLFANLVQQGPDGLASLPPARYAIVQSGIATAFSAAFLTMAAFAAIGLWLAWSIPTRRLS
ncbi:MAG TPA: MFS transporter [Hyphomicrobiaceae bacterium]|jgi:EmrB/QacA subfamily drug resistance transporter